MTCLYYFFLFLPSLTVFDLDLTWLGIPLVPPHGWSVYLFLSCSASRYASCATSQHIQRARPQMESRRQPAGWIHPTPCQGNVFLRER